MKLLAGTEVGLSVATEPRTCKPALGFNLESLMRSANPSVRKKVLSASLNLSGGDDEHSGFMGLFRKRHRNILPPAEGKRRSLSPGMHKSRPSETASLDQALQRAEMLSKLREKFPVSDKQLIELVNDFRILVAMAEGRRLSAEMILQTSDFLTKSTNL